MRLRWKYNAKEAAVAIRRAIKANDQKEARRIYNTYTTDDGKLDYQSQAAANRFTRMFGEGIYQKGSDIVDEL